MQRLHILLTEYRFFEFREELESAELAGEISEFCALTCQAILAIVEGSEFANDYLEMAEAVVSSPCELTTTTESLATYDSSQRNASTAVDRCLAALDHTFRLRSLEQPIFKPYRLHQVEMIDVVLQSLRSKATKTPGYAGGFIAAECSQVVHGACKAVLPRRMLLAARYLVIHERP